MTTLNATAGDASANSYSTILEADDYLMTLRLHADSWFSASNQGHILRHYDDTEETIEPNEKAAALMWATAVLDRLDYRGARATTTQALAWPRSSVYDRYGVLISSTVVPDDLKWATAELALYHLDNPPVDSVPNNIQLDGFQVSGAKPTNTLPSGVNRYLHHLRRAGSGSVNRRVIRA